MPNQEALSLDEKIQDGRYIFLDWNEDHTAVEKKIFDLSTGEITAFPTVTHDLTWNYYVQISGGYYIVNASGGGEHYNGRILKQDFWDGNRKIVPFPDWAIIG